MATRPIDLKPDKDDHESRVTLYRAVGLNEAADIEACGCFRGTQSMGGKWFWTKYSHAIEFGRMKIWNQRPFRVAGATIRSSLLPSYLFNPHLDAIGPAYYVDPVQLPAFNAIVAGTVFVDPLVY